MSTTEESLDTEQKHQPQTGDEQTDGKPEECDTEAEAVESQDHDKEGEVNQEDHEEEQDKQTAEEEEGMAVTKPDLENNSSTEKVRISKFSLFSDTNKIEKLDRAFM